MINFKQIVGNFRDILGNLRDILGNERVNTREGDSHISITIIMVIKRANPCRGFDSLEGTHTRTHAGRQTL
jgi:hypothetical protein